MERISIQEIAAVLCEKNGLKKKDAERFATTLFDVVKEGLSVDRIVKIKGLGTFKIIDIEARESINVNTGERVLIEGHDRITFTPDNTMKLLVNRPFSQFETVVLNEGVDFDDTAVGDDEPENDEVVAEEEEPAVVEDAPKAVEEDAPILEFLETEMEDIVANEEVAVETLEETVEETVEENVEETVEEAKEDLKEESVAESEETEVQPAEELLDKPADKPASEPLNESAELLSDKPKEVPLNEPENSEKEQEEDYDVETESTSHRPGLLFWLLALAACVCSFAAGYYVRGIIDNEASEPILLESIDDTISKDSATVAVVTETAKKENADTTEKAKVDTPVKETAAQPVKETAPQPAKEAVAQSVKEKAETPVGTLTPDQYEQMDARVRTGAYRIVGLDYTLKARSGETLQRMARRTIGPDMECYIEVFNGIKSNAELKEGQTIKIPKLELKKKKKKSNN